MSTKTIIDVIVILKDRLKNLAPDADAQTIAYIVSSIEKLELQISAMMLIEFGEAQVKEIEAASASGLLLIANLMQIEGAALKTLISGSAKSLKDLAVEKTLAFKAFAETVSKDQISAINAAGKQNLIKPQGGILDGAKPFLFGIMHRYAANGAPTLTSQQGQFHSGTNGRLPFKYLLGLHDNPDYNTFQKPPSLQFLKKGAWVYKDLIAKYASSSNLYQYPEFMVSALFVKNDTDSDISRTLYRKFSSRWSSGYEGATTAIGTPNAKNGEVISSLTWTQPHSYTSNTAGANASVSIKIPAKKTVVVTMQNASHYWTSPSSHYAFVNLHGMYNMKTFFGNGIDVDIERTLMAQQKDVESEIDIWK